MRPWLIDSALLCVVLLLICSSQGATLTVSPRSGSGASQVFVLTATGQPRTIEILINATRSQAHACSVRYEVPQNRVAIKDDKGEGWASSGVLGAAAILGNNQCSVELKHSSNSGQLSLSLAIVFQPNFAGSKTVWARAAGRDSQSAAWEMLGTWTAVASIQPENPAWTQIMTPAHRPTYFKYDGATKAELDSSVDVLALPYRFVEPRSAGNDSGLASGVCSFATGGPETPPFWYDFTGHRLAGKYKSTMPSEYFVSPVTSQSATGFKLRASFSGAASGTAVLYETAYFHQQRCDAGGMEFGFYRNVVASQTVFYISNNSNCGIEPSSYCHISDSYTSKYMNEDNYPGQALKTNVNGWGIQNLTIAGKPVQLSELDYSVFIVPDLSAPKGYRFQVDILDPTSARHADCDAYDTSGRVLFVNRPCGFPVRPGGWYQIDELYKARAGYITVGIQRTGTPLVTDRIEFKVDQLSISK